MKKILVVSHCILNTAAKVQQDEAELQEEYRLKKQLMQLVLEQDIQLVQLPCRNSFYMVRRWGHVKDQFMHPHFRKECRKMLEPVLMQMDEYLNYPEEFQVLGIVSVEGSPSCGYHLTCRGRWGGEISDEEAVSEKRATLTMEHEPGVLMQLLESELAGRGMNLSIITMEEAIEKLLSEP